MENKLHQTAAAGFIILLGLAAGICLGIILVDFGHNATADENTPGNNPVLNSRFEAGDFENPETCAGCHGEIYEAWSNSKHRFAWEDPFYQPDYLKASHETEGFTDTFCGECHVPIGVRTGQVPPPDGSLVDDISKKGVSCDYCHTVSEVIEPVNVKAVSDPGNVKRGPRGDGSSPYHEVEFSKIHTDAAFCGACHNVVHPESETVIIDTYDDWKNGPYAEQDIRCQDCHMTPGPGVEKNPGKSSIMGRERDHVATHYFPGGSVLFQKRKGNEEEAEIAENMLEAAAELEAEATRSEKGTEILVRVKNTGAGHKIPTGVTYIRKMWLELTVVDDSGDTVFSSGHTAAENHVDPDTTFYRKLFKDAEGNLTSKSWLAEEIGYDRRIPAKGHDEQVFQIPADAGTGGLHATVRLMYRSMSQKAADKLGIEGLDVFSIEMARVQINIK